MIYTPFPVVLDANVLIPMSVCDTLLSVAAEGMIQIHWTEMILEETRRNLVKSMNIPEQKALNRINSMKRCFPEAMVTGHERLISAMTNDPKDRHVLAAAIHVGAQTIVTSNLRDFKKEDLPASIQAQNPDTFLVHLLDADKRAMLEILHSQAEVLKKPPISFEKLLDGLALSVPKFVDEVRRGYNPPALESI